MPFAIFCLFVFGGRLSTPASPIARGLTLIQKSWLLSLLCCCPLVIGRKRKSNHLDNGNCQILHKARESHRFALPFYLELSLSIYF